MASPIIPKPIQVAPRNYVNERLLCEAIQKQLVVRFRYKDDLQDREFEPSAVYHSPTGKVCVSGIIRSNPNDPEDDLGPHNFEVGLMSSVNMTLIKFVPNLRFDRDDPKYRFGIVCPL
jgi:hypothetical protein